MNIFPKENNIVTDVLFVKGTKQLVYMLNHIEIIYDEFKETEINQDPIKYKLNILSKIEEIITHLSSHFKPNIVKTSENITKI